MTIENEVKRVEDILNGKEDFCLPDDLLKVTRALGLADKEVERMTARVNDVEAVGPGPRGVMPKFLWFMERAKDTARALHEYLDFEIIRDRMDDAAIDARMANMFVLAMDLPKLIDAARKEAQIEKKG